MSRILPRFDAEHERIEDERRLGRLLLETGEAAPNVTAGATIGSDKLRGIPAIGRGCPGRIAGTDPFGALLAGEHRLRRRLR